MNEEERELGESLAGDGEKEGESAVVLPPWLKPLLETTFFSNCKIHGEPNNMYCLSCIDGSLCSSCLVNHRNHHVIQIRRSSYHDVIRVSEIQKVLDISGVQTYVINSAKVVFLNERPQLRPAKGVTNTCRICERSLLDSSEYCSLGCKMNGISNSGHRKKSQSTHSDSSDSGCRKDQMQPPDSKREKRRKGVPHRAPMGCC